MPDQKWFDEQKLDKLEAILAGNTEAPLKTMASIAIQKLKEKEAQKESDRLEQIETQRHEESIVVEKASLAVNKSDLDENRRANVLSVRAMWISGLSLLCSVVIPIVLHGCRSGTQQPAVPPPSAQASNLPPVIKSPLTNALATNTPVTLRTPKP